MFKRYLMVLTLVLALPAFANAWILNAKTSTTGQGTISPAGNKTYAAGVNSDEYTVTPDAALGYKIAKVTLDGVAISTNGNGKYVAPYSATKSYRYLVAYFTKNTVDITVSAGAGGAVREDTFESLTKIPVGSARTFLVIPNPGYTIDTVTAAGATITTDTATGYRVVAFTNLQAPQSVSATFAKTAVFTVSAGNDVTIPAPGAAYAAKLVSAVNTNLGTPTYAWTSSAVEEVKYNGTRVNHYLKFDNAAVASPSVYQDTWPGVYNATVTVTSGLETKTDTVQVTVLDGKALVLNQCTSCHTPNNPLLVEQYVAGAHGAASGHTTGTCQRCHATEGAIAGANAGWTGSYSAVYGDATVTAATWTPVAPVISTAGVSCIACHDTHSGLRKINTYVNGAVVAWNPNGNTTLVDGVAVAVNDQYDVCSSCHTVTGNYHDGGSVKHDRTISDTHFDDPATAASGATAKVEGYVIRSNSATPCADCHNLHKGDVEIQNAWANSAHAGKILVKKNAATGADNAATLAARKAAGALDDADGNAWTHYDWDNRVDCQRCHTATGIANFLSNPAAYDKNKNDFSHLSGWNTTTKTSPQNELLYCWGCHSDSQTGALRNPGAIKEVYPAASTGAATATVTFADYGKSNVCMGCHLGRQVGQNVKDDTDADGVRGFLNSHYLAAGLTISSKGGYEFAGQSYPAGNHIKVGVADAYGTGTEGPCVTCHMSGAEGHTFEVSAASTACAKCHGGLTDVIIEASKHEFHLALEELNTTLKAEGIYFYPAHPYFYTAPYVVGYTETGACSSNLAVTNWNKGGTNIYKATYKTDGKFDKCVLDTTNPAYVAGDVSTWKNRMGAAFNYNLLEHEPGAFAHNRGYALKLIQDSIDYLADGAVDGAGVPAVVTDVQNSREFAEATSHAAPIVEASSATNCAACHTSSPHYGGLPFNKAQYVSTASVPVSCAACHGSASTTANQAILVQYAQSAHADVNGEAWIHFDWRTTNRSNCARCHNGSAFVAKLGNENDTSSVFQAGDVLKPAEALACSACHANAATGELRQVAQAFDITMTNNTANFDVAGASTLCVRCHSGRETGASIAADPDATGIRIFPDVHYQPAAGTLYNKGYDFGLNADLGAHKLLGATGQGPCVTCHMPGKNHSFAAASCATCHDGTTAPAVDAAALKANYDTALNNLKLALAAKGIHYGPVHPFFFTAPYDALGPNTPVTDWAAAYGAANWKNTMGAAYNYNLFYSEKGAYAHNNAYAMKLIADSIDFITDGAVGP